MPASLHFHADPSTLGDLDTLVLIGRRDRLLGPEARALAAVVPAPAWEDMIGQAPRDQGHSAVQHTGERPRKVVVGVLPEQCSRHNTPSRAWAIPGLVRAGGNKGPLGIVFLLDSVAHAVATASALAQALPLYTAVSRPGEHSVHVAFLAPDGAPDLERVRLVAESVRLAASWVDTPPDQLTTTRFVRVARDVAQELLCAIQVVQGAMVRDQGLGGLWGVGRAAKDPPALVVLDHDPPGATRRMAWVGKGITYDTGGLSLKQRTSMLGMKSDMAGAAAVLAAFRAAVRLGCPHRLTAILCIAENAIGPDAIRPDDVLTLLSGRTVEIVNTDAEGRLVLADGVAWAARYREPHDILDLATLTGAQLVATGKNHGAVVCSDEAFEAELVAAGRSSGDVVHPLPYVPELFRGELSSNVADMRNAPKERTHAGPSVAAQFIANHLEGWNGRWAHVDMVGPATTNGRGTGFGVPLLLTLAGCVG